MVNIEVASQAGACYGVERALKKYIVDGTEAKGLVCPNCGQETLVYQEGCLICKNCGASRCG